ncbi:MAG TPA: hypothetical protein VGK15_08320 [Candidatus Limnocylindria bacterium]|jgi:hypothetical protein
MDDRRLTPRASVLSFFVTASLATAASIGLFVLLDPRAQAFWSGRFGDLVNLVRSFFVR